MKQSKEMFYGEQIRVIRGSLFQSHITGSHTTCLI